MSDIFLRLGDKVSPLDEYRFNKYSQNGEDGVLRELLNRMGGIDHLSVVEFGAWDGIYLSNTFNLVEMGAKAVYIEGDERRFEDLVQTSRMYGNITPINAFVEKNGIGANSLKQILSRVGCEVDFDILSIDIDSYDLDIWESLIGFNPKIVVIEINSNYRPGVYVRHDDFGCGSSFSSVLKVGHSKGYTLVAHIGNLIFLRNDYLPVIDFPERFVEDQDLLFNSFWSDMPLYLKVYDRVASFLAKKIFRLK